MRLFVVASVLSQMASALAREEVVVSCMGDSITAGSTASSPLATWPALLEAEIENVVVKNFGKSGKTVMDTEDAYVKTKFYASALKSNADINIIALGTNDAKDEHWDEPNFVESYAELVNVSLANYEDTVLLVPIPQLEDGWYWTNQVINTRLPQLVRDVAEDFGEYAPTVVDVSAAFNQSSLYYADIIHPNDLGYALIAHAVADAVRELVEEREGRQRDGGRVVDSTEGDGKSGGSQNIIIILVVLVLAVVLFFAILLRSKRSSNIKKFRATSQPEINKIAVVDLKDVVAPPPSGDTPPPSPPKTTKTPTSHSKLLHKIYKPRFDLEDDEFSDIASPAPKKHLDF